MEQRKLRPWQAEDSTELYGIERWGNDYFGLSAEGNVTAKTLNTEVALLDIIKGMVDRDLQMPVLLRVENILDAQIMRLNEAFAAAIAQVSYTQRYRGVYPIKVNQQAQVVEEIAAFGERYGHGFEVGSKPEMIIALSALTQPGSLIICNGYKDEEFIDLGLQAIKLGFDCFFVIETPSELPMIIERSRAMDVRPNIGIRIKMVSQVSGHWNSTSGDRSIFGLTASQLVAVVDSLRQAQMLDCLKLMHCHLGSQIPSLSDIQAGVVEACRYYIDLVREGAALSHIDFGGGLAVDYTGAKSSDDQSRNYSLEDYCQTLVNTVKTTLDAEQIAHPIIVTESGRALVAYSSVLLFNVLDTTKFESTEQLPAEPLEHQLLTQLRSVVEGLNEQTAEQCYEDIHRYREQIRDGFNQGQIDLRCRAHAENIFLDTLHSIAALLDTMVEVPALMADLKLSLADIYYGNFSLFQSLPDIWAIDQLFPVMPIHRLAEEPTRQAVLADITCDCDGKIDQFIGLSKAAKTLPLHPLKASEEYYLGVFLVGAYQETLGDLHNLFGDTNVVSVRLNRDGSFDFVKEIHGDTIADVLSYVEYQPRQVELNYRNTAERAVREGRITAAERQQMIKAFKASMQGYTYYEREH
ncbi:biosynthetic arginine decarboxylase [SAR92 clade bacterium H455]|uniref:Arginine decarboxylase n=1 Tax=SAR92 clade bacterium H455 TaxID=2974818 RepID=A0ABY5TQC4_9GAMM|nr:biosynthetic arginine decarboxylase [SAR92 clade bacterium H455]